MHRDFVALVVPLDPEGRAFIKKLENPKHDSLSAEWLADETRRVDAKSIMKRLVKFIRDTIKSHTLAQFGEAKGRVLGNPVRRSFVEAAQLAMTDPAGVEARARRVLVLGGSQGAKTLNDVVPSALALASLAALNLSVLHQTGESQVDAVKRRYQELGVDAEVVPFIDDMARAYASASLVIARAGATTLAELCAIGKPSILIPYPHAAEDHQMKNARAMEQAGAAIAISESELSAEGLAKQARALLVGRSQRQAMADAARVLGRPEAAAAIVDDLCTYLGVPVDGGTGAGGEGERYPQGPNGSGAQSSAQVALQSTLEAETTLAADGTTLDADGSSSGSELDAAAHYSGMLTRPAVRKPRVRRAPLRVRAVEHAAVH